MPTHDKQKILKGKKAIIVILVILLLFVASLNILAGFGSRENQGGMTFITRTFTQIGDTVFLVRDYANSVFTGESLPNRNEDVSPTEGTDEDNDVTPLSPPSVGQTTILNSVITRILEDRGTFIINTNLRANENLEVRGTANFGDITVSGTTDTRRLTVRETMEALGLIEALGGITTGGANIDLEGGTIIGLDLDFVREIVAGQNVEIVETDGVVTISVPEAGRRSGGGSSAGVTSVNGQTGAVTFIAGTDIAITGLTIENISTLESVRLRGGCVGCITDSDVAENLTITGGIINDTIIGAVNQAAGYFTGISIGTTNTSSALTVLGDGSFTGTVSGANAIELDDFVTLAQLNAAIGSGGGTAGVASLNSLTGALFIAGTAGQITVSSAGDTITLSLPQNIAASATPTFAGLFLNGLLDVTGDVDVSGVVTAGTFISDVADASVRKSGEEIFRMSTSIFPYALPADTGSATFVRVSKEFTATFDNPIASTPTPVPGTTRIYKFVIKYADSIPTLDDSSWRVYKPSSGTTIDTFTLGGMNKADLDEPEVVVTDPITIPTDDWRLEVSIPSGRIRVMDIHIVAFDVVN
ncbi:MAG: hypothetical protein WDZ74_01620 [Candidatus Paceibacterota bacterium]